MAKTSGNSDSRRTLVQRWLGINPLHRSKVYSQIYASVEFSNLSYWLGILFSSAIATFGLVQNSPAVIIGAMLISPLMGPIMALGLGTAMGDLYLSVKAIANLMMSMSVAVGFSALIVWLLPFHDATGEILSRTNPTLLDLGIALFSGLAGSVILGRANSSDGMTTLPGVAIAVALMPPLGVIGFGLGVGMDSAIIRGAGLLFVTNLVAIVASAFLVFLLIGMNSANLSVEMKLARKDEWFERKFLSKRLSRPLAHSGRIGWRILVMIVLLGSLSVPLHRAFVQVAGEAVARSAVQNVINGLLPAGSVVSQQVNIAPDSIAIQLFSTKVVSPEKISEAEQAIQQRSGRKADISVVTVASQSELAQMLSKSPAARSVLPVPPATAKSLNDLHQQLLDRIAPVLSNIWPSTAPLIGYDVTFTASGTILNVRYQKDRELDRISLDGITHALRQELNVPDLVLKAQREPLMRKKTKTQNR